MNKSLIKETRDRVEASKRVGILSLPASNLFAIFWGPANSFCSLVKLARKLLQKLHKVQNPEAIVIEI